MYNKSPKHFSTASRSTNGFESVVGTGMTIAEGTLASTTNTRIDGHVKAPVEVLGDLMITESARVEGDVVAQSVVVAGVIIGKIRAGEVEIQETGRVYGNIVTNELSTQKGAFIDGKLIMQDEEASPDDVVTFQNEDDDPTEG